MAAFLGGQMGWGTWSFIFPPEGMMWLPNSRIPVDCESFNSEVCTCLFTWIKAWWAFSSRENFNHFLQTKILDLILKISFNQQSFPCEVHHWGSLRESLQVLKTQLDNILSTCSSWSLSRSWTRWSTEVLSNINHPVILRISPPYLCCRPLWKKQECFFFLYKDLHWCQ